MGNRNFVHRSGVAILSRVATRISRSRIGNLFSGLSDICFVSLSRSNVSILSMRYAPFTLLSLMGDLL
jgi:hypothetical protein